MKKNIKKLKKEITENAAKLRTRDFYSYLCGLQRSLTYEFADIYRVETCMEYATRTAERMCNQLRRGRWPELEIVALGNLDDFACGEDDIIWVTEYGLPVAVEDNAHLLRLLAPELT